MPKLPGQARSNSLLAASAMCALTILMLSACQAAPEPLDDGVAAFDLLVEGVLIEARDGGASVQQLAVLEEAKVTRAVSAESLRAGNQAAAECLTNVGFNVEFEDYVSNAGLSVPAYSVHTGDVGDDVALELQEGCEYAENYWINKLFWLQPSSIAINNAYLVRQTPALIECVKTNGGTASTGDDTRSAIAAAEQLLKTSDGSVNCLLEVGIDIY